MYPHYICWKIDISKVSDADHIFGSRTGKKLRKARELLLKSPYIFKVESVTEALLDAFTPLYEENIGTKKNAAIFPVKDRIMKSIRNGENQEMVSLYEHGTFVGGMIYNIKEQNVSVSFKVFPKTPSIKLPVNLSILAEYMLITRALELGKPTIVHGRDRNAYGQNSNIGLAMYKLQIGSVPYVSATKENPSHDEHTAIFSEDTLIFLAPKEGDKITRATLYTNKSEETARTDYHTLFTRPYLETTISFLT